MAGPECLDAFELIRNFRADEPRLNAALRLFVEREDFGFVWLAYREDRLVGCCSVGYGIATGAGGVVAVVRDLYVVPQARRSGVASAMLEALEARLAALEITRIDVPAAGAELAAFLVACQYAPAGVALFTRDR